MAALASVADVEDITGPVPPAAHERIENLILKVSAVVRRYTGQTFDLVEDDVVTVRPRDGLVRLPQQPVIAVTSVTYAGVSLDPSTYEVTANGYLRPLTPPVWSGGWANWTDEFDRFTLPAYEFLWPPQPMTVTYTHGYAEPPYDLALVVAERVATMYRFGVENTQAEAIDGYSVHYQKPAHSGPWSEEHKMVLDSYRRSGAASLRLVQ